MPALRRLILAEDDPTLRHLLATELAAAGYQVTEARDGPELLACLEAAARTPGQGRDTLAVISDVRMPGLDGLDVLAALRCASWSTPVILMTAFPDAATGADARALGAACVLEKPVDVARLRRAIEALDAA